MCGIYEFFSLRLFFSFDIAAGSTARFTLTGDSTFINIERVNVFFPEAYLSLLFNASKDGAYAERVCGIMEESCTDVWTENAFANQSECKASVEAMPKVEGSYFDGRSQGCRWVHSVLAATNKDHCEHISTLPLEDVNGKVKCQNTTQTPMTSVFSAAELHFYKETAMNKFDFDESMISIC